MTSLKSPSELNIQPLLGGVLVAVSLGCLAYLAIIGWQILFPPPVFEAHMDGDCDLHAGPCSAQFGDGSRATLAISPKRPTAKKPVRLTVVILGREAKNVRVELRGARMDMGLFDVPLLDIGHGLFAVDTSLPVCVRDRMTWSASVVSDGPQGTHRAGFSFDMLTR